MPDQSSAAEEHALIQDLREPLSGLPAEDLTLVDTEFPTVLRGYDKFAVDAYVRRTERLIEDLQARNSPQAAVRRALERVGDDVSGILQRAHDTAEGITTQSRREAEDRLEVARREASQMTSWARARVKELDVDTDRIWAERDRIVADARALATQLVELADAAAARFPAAGETSERDGVVPDVGAGASEQVDAPDPDATRHMHQDAPDPDATRHMHRDVMRQPLPDAPRPIHPDATQRFDPDATQAFRVLPFDADVDE